MSRSRALVIGEAQREGVLSRLMAGSRPVDGGCVEWVRSKIGPYGHLRCCGNVELAHRVAWAVHRGCVPEGMAVCHRCDNPACVNLDHLFLGTDADNVADMHAKGRQADTRGEGNPVARLTAEQVIAIRRDQRSGSEIGRDLGVHSSTVNKARSGVNWSHV